jgi:hypothetical protein
LCLASTNVPYIENLGHGIFGLEEFSLTRYIITNANFTLQGGCVVGDGFEDELEMSNIEDEAIINNIDGKVSRELVWRVWKI